MKMMSNEECIEKLEFIRNGYQNLIDNDLRSGEAIGKDIKFSWEAPHTMKDVYEKMIEALNIAIETLQEKEEREKYDEWGRIQ